MIYYWSERRLEEVETLYPDEPHIRCIPGGVESLVDANGLDWNDKNRGIQWVNTQTGELGVIGLEKCDKQTYLIDSVIKTAAPMRIRFRQHQLDEFRELESFQTERDAVLSSLKEILDG